MTVQFTKKKQSRAKIWNAIVEDLGDESESEKLADKGKKRKQTKEPTKVSVICLLQHDYNKITFLVLFMEYIYTHVVIYYFIIFYNNLQVPKRPKENRRDKDDEFIVTLGSPAAIIPISLDKERNDVIIDDVSSVYSEDLFSPPSSPLRVDCSVQTEKYVETSNKATQTEQILNLTDVSLHIITLYLHSCIVIIYRKSLLFEVKF